MKKLLYTFMLLPLITIAQTVDDWSYAPVISESGSVIFPMGTLADFDGYEIKAYAVKYIYAGPVDAILGIPPIDSTIVPTSETIIINEDGSAGIQVMGTDEFCGCSQAAVGDLIRFFVNVDGNFVQLTITPSVIYASNMFVFNFDSVEFSLSGSDVVFGCTDVAYLEFNSNAIIDNGTCSILVIEGCMNPTASNYNEFANTDDGSCLIAGCMNTTAENYNINASIDDGSCIIYGCTDSTAINYNADANIEDGSCEAIVAGCSDLEAINYNPDANFNDSSCEYECTDPNYVEFYNESVYGCITPLNSDILPWMFTSPVNTGANMTIGVNTSTLYQFAGGVLGAFYHLDGDGTPEIVGSEPITTGFFGLALWGNNSSSPEADGLSSGAVPNWAILYDGNVIYLDEYPEFTGYVTNGISMVTNVTFSAYGCTDNSACNTIMMYDQVNYTDDGSCEYPGEYYNCDGNCLNDIDSDGVCDELEIEGCQDSSAGNYNPLATDPGFCIYYGCIDESACNYDEFANEDDGSCEYPGEYYNCDGNCLNDIDSDGVCDELEIEGCQDSSSDNYNPIATDPGFCIYYGCLDESACNYDEFANEDDGLCIFPEVYLDCLGNCINDTDQDQVCDEEDNCIDVINPVQTDSDNDGEGDACDYDDGIGIDEISADIPTLIKMIDVLGREQNEHKKGTLLFYIYDNGLVEKRVTQ